MVDLHSKEKLLLEKRLPLLNHLLHLANVYYLFLKEFNFVPVKSLEADAYLTNKRLIIQGGSFFDDFYLKNLSNCKVERLGFIHVLKVKYEHKGLEHGLILFLGDKREAVKWSKKINALL